MLQRFVRMSFQEEHIKTFKELFSEVQPKIKEFEGCHSVQLLQDSTDKKVFMTFSVWDSEDALNNYRESDFFKATWRKTKVLFKQKPEAFSMNIIQ
ncbi:putative quinol monooxygenase [Flammeovirga agarivorans]|uniref:Antibiotic biosynthesis monooxygenase n=1 Tax=Flammeovirga agarivorans TaxID=2726742 RepID=A0A7X8SPY1_9BACT|nr:antibiotic biosynthesis monooxygenase family protein [Flammeovirga agarivorans]NLR94224.1 antibiotic biosynthesis monooxygenase [Flammeovirga agarivorans]